MKGLNHTEIMYSITENLMRHGLKYDISRESGAWLIDYKWQEVGDLIYTLYPEDTASLVENFVDGGSIEEYILAIFLENENESHRKKYGRLTILPDSKVKKFLGEIK